MGGMAGSAVPLEDLLSRAEVVASVPPEGAEAHAKGVVRLLEDQETAHLRCRKSMGWALEA